jgi:Protein of unknown function (DUF1194)
MGRLHFLLTLMVTLSLQTSADPIRADMLEVDLALVLAVDISHSMDEEEQTLQRQGFIEAFRSPLVHKAVSEGAVGRISVTYVEWAGTDTQRVVVPWTVIDGQKSAMAFADQLARSGIGRGPYTSLAGAIRFGTELLGKTGVSPLRQVIDISGDGVNNDGALVTQARDEAVSRGIAINGLPIMLSRPIGEEFEYLDNYYKDCVIGGPGAFVIPVWEPEQLAMAVKTKLILEVAGLTTEPRIKKAHADVRIDCATGRADVVGWMRH